MLGNPHVSGVSCRAVACACSLSCSFAFCLRAAVVLNCRVPRQFHFCSLSYYSGLDAIILRGVTRLVCTFSSLLSGYFLFSVSFWKRRAAGDHQEHTSQRKAPLPSLVGTRGGKTRVQVRVDDRLCPLNGGGIYAQRRGRFRARRAREVLFTPLGWRGRFTTKSLSFARRTDISPMTVGQKVRFYFFTSFRSVCRHVVSSRQVRNTPSCPPHRVYLFGAWRSPLF